MEEKMHTSIYSEIGELQGVIAHFPGQEVENMTPENAERALYSDILNLGVAKKEYNQFKGILKLFSQVFEVKDLLKDILKDPRARKSLVKKICYSEKADCISSPLMDMDVKELSRSLIEGIALQNNTLTNFLSKDRFSLKPLHNFFFTRDASFSVYDNIFVGSMASKVRLRESLIMEAIFNFHPRFSKDTINPDHDNHGDGAIAIEGGDVLIANDDIIICGIGSRTTTQGVDFLLKHLQKRKEKQHILVQELPLSPESFIHLDMVFTLLDKDLCMIYEPVIMKMNKYQTVHIYAEGGHVKYIREIENLPQGLRKLGMEVELAHCGGPDDRWLQEREQWHSGANFLALGPGQIMGYARNINTLEALNNTGFDVIKASDILRGRVKKPNQGRFVITIDGSELPRGGGGTRCMTMPVRRNAVVW